MNGPPEEAPTTDPTEIAELDGRARALRLWWFVYLTLWLGGILLMIVGWAALDVEAVGLMGLAAFLGSAVPYFGAMVCAYRVQSRMRELGLGKHGGWHVIIAMVFLNPYLLGFYVPLSVLFAYRQARRDIDRRGAP